MRALKDAGTILAGIVGAVALIFLLIFFTALYIAGFVWVSENVHEYLNIAATIAFAVCIFILLPLRVVPRYAKMFHVWPLYFVRDFRRVPLLCRR
jgi:hypothetical protein